MSLAFDNINAAPDGDAVPGYGVDHVAVAEGLGCKAIRVRSPNEFEEVLCLDPALTIRRGQDMAGSAAGLPGMPEHAGAR